MSIENRVAVLLCACASAAAAQVAGIDALYPEMDALYLDLHKTPELSGHEVKTAAKMAEQLRKLGFEVTTGVGGTGVVGVLRNGNGPAVMLRTELDALPVEEKTGLPYASKVTTIEPSGRTVPVMHACGHDIHMTSWVATATLLSRSKERWRGTLVMIGQPAEETVAGAQGMIADGLFKRFPKPDYVLAIHDAADVPAGKVTVVPGYAAANVDSIDITIFGKGAHGARPEDSVDPVVLAARTVLALQTIVARENSPRDPAVLTVGSIHGGTRYNIIPDEVKLQLTVRSYKPEVRERMMKAISRIVKGEAASAGAPREPTVVVSESASSMYNDPKLSKRMAAALGAALGSENVLEGEPVMTAEDFGQLGTAAGAPSVQIWVGATEPAKFAAAKKSGERLPGLHSPLFAPDRERTLRTGAATLTTAALEVLGKPGKENN
jgi:amidohydrolase